MPIIFIFFLYRLLQVLGAPLIVLYLVWRAARNPEWRRSIPGRFGGLPFGVTAPGGVWLHAVSVGEVISAVNLLKTLQTKLPDTPLYVSVTTTTGYALAQQKLKGLCDGIFYTPLDFRFAVRRVLKAIKPSLLLVMETEIWPNLWREARRSGAGLLVVNGRISDKALPAYRRWRWFFAPVLGLPHAIYAQSEQDVERFLALGAPAERVHSGRNLKYDFDPDAIQIAPEIAAWVRAQQPGHTLIAASTMPGADSHDGDEDDLTLPVFEQLAETYPRLLWIHVPRRPERFDLVATKLTQRNINFVRRSRLQPVELPAVLLLDTLGELGGVFRLADAVFMGGTLVRRGGHNILEPAFFGKPVIAGPHMENFAEIAADFSRHGGLKRIESAGELAPAFIEILENPQQAAQQATNAQKLAEGRRGATDLAVQAALDTLEQSWPKTLHSLSARLFFTPLSWLWALGSA